MVGFLRAFRRDDRGMTSIEYALLAGVMGTGVAVSASYVVDEISSFVAAQAGCTWEVVEADENGDGGATRCVSASGGWTARRPARKQSAQ